VTQTVRPFSAVPTSDVKLYYPERGCTEDAGSNEEANLVAQKRPSLVFQWDHRLIATAESGYTQQAALPMWHGHYWTVAIYGVPGLSEIPFAAFVLTCLLAGGGGKFSRWRQLRDWKGKD
jgi:hypothetical protein